MDSNKVQLIIEALNKTQKIWDEFTVQVDNAKIDVIDLNRAAAAAGDVIDVAATTGAQAMKRLDLAAVESAERMKRVGLSVAAFRDYVAGAQAELPALHNRVTALSAPFAALDTIGTAAGTALEDTGNKGSQGLDKINNSARQAHSMLVQMMQMAAITGALLGMRQVANAGIDYNKTLETSELGLSAIITSMGVVTDQQGRVLQGQEKWNAANQLSLQAQRELQKIGMLTSATYTELVEVYQGILAPALSAKMTFRETLDITGLLTNSVKAIGLPINQIKQEARDLIQGGIQPASSSLAVALGISDAMVKKWREQGTVYQELKSRLEGFTYASREFANTWDGAWSNFKDVAQRALGEGSKPLFDTIKREVIQLTSDMTNITRDSAGTIIDIQIKPEVTARIRQLADDLGKLINMLETAVKWGGKLAEPLLWAGVAVGINKITTAVKELAIAASAGGLAKLMSSLPALAAVAAIYVGKQYADYGNQESSALGIRRGARVGMDHDSARLKASGIDPLANLDEFGAKQLGFVRQQLPAATNAQIATMLRQGIIQMIKRNVPGFDEHYFAVNINDAAAEKFMNSGATSPFGLKGPNNPGADELAKAKKLAEEWQKTLADLRLDIDKSDQDPFEQRISEFEAKAAELTKKFTGPEQRQVINDWLASQTTRSLDDYTKKLDDEIADAELKTAEAWDAYDNYVKDLAKKKAQEHQAVAESAARNNIANITAQEKFGAIGKNDAAQQQIEQYHTILAAQQDYLTFIDRVADPTGWLSQQNAIDRTREKMTELELVMRDYAGSGLDGFHQGLTDLINQAATPFQQLRNLAQQTAQGMEQSFADFFFDAMQGKLKSLGDYIMSFLTAVQKAVANVFAQNAAQAIIGGLGSFFSATPGATVNGGSGALAPGVVVAHSGGLIVPRFHFGGLASDEVPAILQTRERVLSREQNQLFEKFTNKTESSGSAPSVSINIENKTGAAVKATEGNLNFDGKRWVKDIVLELYNSSPSFRNTLSGGA